MAVIVKEFDVIWMIEKLLTEGGTRSTYSIVQQWESR